MNSDRDPDKTRETELQQQYRHMNQPVWMTDILVKLPPTTHGEFESLYENNENRLARIKEQIALHITLLKIFYSKKYHLTTEEKSAHPANHVVRLLTHEYSFFTYRTPLEEKEFIEIVEFIKKAAGQLPLNIILLFSTFAVRDVNDEILNVFVEAQCGDSPQLIIDAKLRPSRKEELHYPHFTNKTLRKSADFSTHTLSFKDLPLTHYGGILHAKTLGKAEFLSFTEVCLDHKNKKSKRSLIRFIDSQRKSPAKLLPLQVSQVVTSHSMPIKQDAVFWQAAVGIDPKRTYSIDDKKLTGFATDFLHCLQEEVDANYALSFKDGVLFVSKPPFGKALMFQPSEPYCLAHFRGVYGWRIKNYNEWVFHRNKAAFFQLGEPKETTQQNLIAWVDKKLSTLDDKLINTKKHFSTTAAFEEEKKCIQTYRELLKKINTAMEQFEKEFSCFIIVLKKAANELPASLLLAQVVESIEQRAEKLGLTHSALSLRA